MGPEDITSKPPFAITTNSFGDQVEWWIHPELTKCAMRKDANGVLLPNVRCCLTRTNGILELLLLDGQEPVYSSQSTEAIAAHIDFMKADKYLPK